MAPRHKILVRKLSKERRLPAKVPLPATTAQPLPARFFEILQKQKLPANHPASSERSQDGKHVLKLLRWRRHFSQRALARKMQISRAKLRRLESKPCQNLYFKEILMIARGFHTSVNQILDYFMHAEQPSSGRFFDLRVSRVTQDYGQGVRLATLLENGQESFAGMLTLPAQGQLSSEQCIKADAIFYFVLDGELTIRTLMEEKTIKIKQGLYLRGHTAHEIFNLQPVQRTIILILSCSWIDASTENLSVFKPPA